MTKIVAIAGGTASGKTTLARDLLRLGGEDLVQIVPLDAYYQCNGHLPLEQRAAVNYDHPLAFEISVLAQQLAVLSRGEVVDIPVYDFATHSRSADTKRIKPTALILVEGILALHFTELRSFYSRSVFVDTPEALRLSRRIARDVRERGRTEASVHEQWNENVHPMHLEFCEPTKAIALEIFNGAAWNDEQVLALLERLG